MFDSKKKGEEAGYTHLPRSRNGERAVFVDLKNPSDKSPNKIQLKSNYSPSQRLLALIL